MESLPWPSAPAGTAPAVARTAVLALVVALLPGAARAANQTVINCSNDSELHADLASIQETGGGTLNFACGTATIVLTSNLPTITQPTTVDGGATITISGGNSRRIFVVGASAMLTLTDIVLSNGSSTGDGGAIFSSGALDLERATIRNSYAALSGGAFVAYGPTSILNSELSSNTAANGGAVYARFPGAPVTIENSILQGNMASPNAFTNGLGGAVFLWDGALVTIRDSVIRDNDARLGGGIYNGFQNSSVTIERSKIADNTTHAGSGGGIYVNGGPLELVDSDVVGNASPGNGGGLFYRDGTSAAILRTTFRENYGAYGGGIWIENATGVSLVNVTISGNDANEIGGLSSVNSSVSLSHVTIASNTSANLSGALLQNAPNGRVVTVRNSLLANNPANCQVVLGTLLSGDGNVSSDASCLARFTQGHDQHNASVLLGPLGDRGGFAPTQVPSPGSAAIDAGVLDGAPAEDQRGVKRPQGTSVDSGAVEVAACSPGPALCGDGNENQSLSAADALEALRTAVGSAACPLWLCDFNGSGSVTASDALGILRAAVGQAVTPACPPKWDCRA